MLNRWVMRSGFGTVPFDERMHGPWLPKGFSIPVVPGPPPKVNLHHQEAGNIEKTREIHITGALVGSSSASKYLTST